MTGLLRQERQRIYQPSPLSLTAAPSESFKSADFEDRRDGPPEPRFEHVSGKGNCRSPFRFSDAICFVQDEQEVGNLFGNGLDKGQFVSGDRRISTDYDDGRVYVRDECMRSGSVPRKYGAETRRIHEAHALRKQRAGDRK